VKSQVSPSDEELINLCCAESEAGWSEFVERFSSLIRHSIKRKLSRATYSSSGGDVDDIFQHVFTSIWSNKKLKSLRSIESLRAYLVIIAHGCTIDYLRRKGRPLEPYNERWQQPSKVIPANPRTETQGRQLQKAVEKFIDGLPLKEHRIMTLDLFYDLSHQQISSIMAIPINTVSTIIARTKTSLREELKQRGYYE